MTALAVLVSQQTRERVRPMYFGAGVVAGLSSREITQLVAWGVNAVDEPGTYTVEARHLLLNAYPPAVVSTPHNASAGVYFGHTLGSGYLGGLVTTGTSAGGQSGEFRLIAAGQVNATVTVRAKAVENSTSTVETEDHASDLDRFRTVLSRWVPRLQARTSIALDVHVGQILNPEELADRSTTPQLGSFEELLAYLAARPNLKPPSLGLRKDGVFAAAWSPEGKARVNLEFLGGGKVRCIFVDARPDQKRPVKGAIELGVDKLDVSLASMGCEDWMKL